MRQQQVHQWGTDACRRMVSLDPRPKFAAMYSRASLSMCKISSRSGNLSRRDIWCQILSISNVPSVSHVVSHFVHSLTSLIVMGMTAWFCSVVSRGSDKCCSLSHHQPYNAITGHRKRTEDISVIFTYDNENRHENETQICSGWGNQK